MAESASDFKAGSKTEKELLNELNLISGGSMRITSDSNTGKIRSLSIDYQENVRESAGVSEVNPEESSRRFLNRYGILFGIADESKELKTEKTKILDGRSFARFQQLYSDIPVFGGEMIVQSSKGNVVWINGKILPTNGIDVNPVITSGEARVTAMNAVAKWHSLNKSILEATEPELWIYNPQVFDLSDSTKLVWKIEVSPAEISPVDELILVDAKTGIIALHFNQIDDARNRYVYDKNNVRSNTLPGTSSQLKRIEGNGSSGIADVDELYNYSGDTYDFYNTYFGRDSIDNAGMNITSTARFCYSSLYYSCPYNNAFWTDDYQQLVFGDGVGADDVVGHELTHGVTSHESGLIYYSQSGAINEALSDIFGEFIDLNNSAGNDSVSVRWLMGEDCSLGVLRDMSNPPAYDDPDRMGSTNYYCGSSNSIAVHTNSGVGNKAAYLMTDGGTFNGYTITGIGMTKTAQLFYEANTNLLAGASEYKDLYLALTQAGINLGFSSSDRLEIEKVLNATEMNQEPYNCNTNEASICSSGSMLSLFYDDFSNSSSGLWAHGASSGPDKWSYNDTYVINSSHLQGGDYDDISSTYIQMTTNVSIPAGNSFLHFRHAYSFEYDETYLICWDGGVIDYSTNGGTTWNDADALILTNGYTGTIQNTAGNPLGGREGFCSTSQGNNSLQYSSKINLTSLAGQNVRFRFTIGSDEAVGDGGWFIDDFRIYSCGFYSSSSSSSSSTSTSVETSSSSSSSSSSTSSSFVLATSSSQISSSSSSSSSSSISAPSTLPTGNLACTGSATHSCTSWSDVMDINRIYSSQSANCGSSVNIVVNWTGWHYEDNNYWGIFLNDNNVGSCTSFIDDLDVNNAYLMNCSFSIPSTGYSNGVYNLTITGNDADGYCNPGEANIYYSQLNTTITLANCDATSQRLFYGWNLIGVSLNVSNTSASSVLSSSGCNRIARFVNYGNSSSGWEQYYTSPVTGGTNFNLSLGQGYFMKCDVNTTLNLTGSITTGFTSTVYYDWNLLAWTNTTGTKTASNVLAGVTGAYRIARFVNYGNGTAGWEQYYTSPITGGTDFTLNHTLGYFMKTSQNASWNR